MSDSERFTEEEKKLIYRAVKSQKYVSEEYAELYEKVSTWYLGADNNQSGGDDPDA